ncbi:MAG TPA: hypothetical protein VIL69_13365 [Roseomonas sp.]
MQIGGPEESAFPIGRCTIDVSAPHSLGRKPPNYLTAQFEAATCFVRPEDLRETVHVSADLGQHAALLAECAAIGFESMDLHQVGGDQRAFIEVFADRVLPQLRRQHRIA